MRKISFLKNLLILTISILLTISIFYLILTKIDLIKTIDTLKSIKINYLVLCIFISITINIFIYADIRRVIWQNLEQLISYKELIYIRLGSLPFKVIPSFKNTDIVSAIYLKKFHNIPITQSILTNIIANIFDLMSILLIFSTGYIVNLIYHIDISQYQQYFSVMFIIFVFLIIAIYAFILKQNIGKKLLFLLFFRKNSKHIELLNKIMKKWKELPVYKNILLLIYTFIFQLSELIIFYFFSRSLNLNIPVTSILLYLPLIIIISQLPISFFGFGIREGAYIIFFIAFGTKETLFALGLIVFFVNQIVPIFIGFVFTLHFLHKLQFSEIRNNINDN